MSELFPVENQILERQTELIEAELSGDLPKLDSILAEDYEGFGPSGELMKKNDVIGNYRSGTYLLKELQTRDVVVKVLQKDAGIITGIVTLEGTFQNKPFSTTLRYTDVYVRRAGEWKLVASQVTRLSEKS